MQAMSKGKYVTLISIFTIICVGVMLQEFASVLTTGHNSLNQTKGLGRHLPFMPGIVYKTNESRIHKTSNLSTDEDSTTNLFSSG